MRSILVFAASATMAFAAQAQEESTSKVKTSDVAPVEQPQADIDQEITNKKLRAELGSKSKWSIKTYLSYSGGSVERPLDRIRPAYQAGATVPALTNLGGTVGVKYSLTNRDSLSLSTGILVRNPFHGDLSRDNFDDPRSGKNTERLNASNPSLTYTRAYKAAGMQMISSAGWTQYTETDTVRDYNAFGGISLSQTVLANFENSGWEAGLSFALGLSFYNGDMDPDFVARNVARGTTPQQEDFSYAIYPFAEYAFNDRFSFRTVFGYFNLTHYKGSKGDKATVETVAPYQSVGLGMSVTRDIYLYPNIQFTPFDIRADRTNVAMSATMNVF